MRELLGGPGNAEAAAGLTSAIPSDAQVLGLHVDGGVATVDLSSEFAAGGTESELEQRVAQVVYTLTQFPAVQTVAFKVDGTAAGVPRGDGSSTTDPVGRDDYLQLVPPILVEQPRWGETVGPAIEVSGRAESETGRVHVELQTTDGSAATADPQVDCGRNCAGAFSTHLTAPATTGGTARLIVSIPLDDGTHTGTRVYRIDLAP